MTGLFDLEYHEKKIREYQSPLAKLNIVINTLAKKSLKNINQFLYKHYE